MENSLDMIIESSEESNVKDSDKIELSTKLNNSEDLKNSLNNKLIRSLENGEIKEHLNNLFSQYYQSGRTNLKNLKKSFKREKISTNSNDVLNYIHFKKYLVITTI